MYESGNGYALTGSTHAQAAAWAGRERAKRYDFRDGAPVLKRTAERFFSQMSPAITTPFKLLSGYDPYTGRPLKEMHNMLGNVGASTLLAGSPFSRVASTGGQILNKRKPWQAKLLGLTTGVKVSTTDLNKQRLYELQKANDDDLKDEAYIREGHFPYVPERFKHLQTEETTRQLRLRQALANSIRRLAEEQEREGEQEEKPGWLRGLFGG